MVHLRLIGSRLHTRLKSDGLNQARSQNLQCWQLSTQYQFHINCFGTSPYYLHTCPSDFSFRASVCRSVHTKCQMNLPHGVGHGALSSPRSWLPWRQSDWMDSQDCWKHNCSNVKPATALAKWGFHHDANQGSSTSTVAPLPLSRCPARGHLT